jgi:hypothetical protein
MKRGTTLARRAVLVGAAVVCAVALSPAGSASARGASPEVSCALTFIGSTAASVNCIGTTRQYRVKVLCEDPLRGSDSYYYGPYVNPGATSTKKCPYQGGVQWLVVSATWQYR